MDDSKKTFIEIMPMDRNKSVLESIKAKDSDNYCHYTAVENAQNILNGKYLYISSMEKMNDIDEVKKHASNCEKTFIFSMCNSTTENIPMWYLYSGILGSGVRIRFTKTTMLNFLESIDKIYPVENDSVVSSTPLLKNDDFDIAFDWVCYVDDINKKIKHRNKFYKTILDINDRINYFDDYFIKKYPWNYENEFRIVIHNKNKTNYKRLAIPIDESIIKNLRIMFAPELNIDKKLYTQIKQKFIDLGIKEKNIETSKLNIRMNLLNRNKVNIVDSMESWCDNQNYRRVCSYIQKNYMSWQIKKEEAV